MAEEFIIRLLDGAAEGGSRGQSKGGGGISTLAGLTGIGSIMQQGMKQLNDVIGSTIDVLLEPIKAVLKGIVKIIGELLRPIAEVVTILLRPVLTLLKPFIQMFKTMMAPFMEIARQFSDMSQQQMAQGNVSGAMQLSLQAVITLIGPFIIALVSVAWQLTTTLVIGAISFLIDNLLTILIAAFSSLGFIGKGAVDALTKAQESIADGSAAAISSINDLIMTNTTKVLDSMQQIAEDQLQKAREKYGTGFYDNIIDPPLSSLKDAKVDFDLAGQSLTASVKTGINGMTTTTASGFGAEATSIPSVFSSGLNLMETAVTGFVDKMKTAADNINNISVGKRGGNNDNDLIDLKGSSLIKININKGGWS